MPVVQRRSPTALERSSSSDGRGGGAPRLRHPQAAAAGGADEPTGGTTAPHHQQHLHVHFQEDPEVVGADPAAAAGGETTKPPSQWALGRLVDAFGVKPVAGLGVSFFLIRGVLVSGLSTATLAFFRDVLQVKDSAVYQRYSSVPILAWAAKPGIGLLADSVPLCGYRKRVYLQLAATLAASSVAALGLIAFDVLSKRATSTTATAVAPTYLLIVSTILFFTSNLGMSTVDLLVESVYAQLMRRRRDTGSTIVSWCWAVATVGSVMSLAVTGPLADAGHVPEIMLMLAVAALGVAVPPMLNWFQEPRVSTVVVVHDDEGDERGRLARRRRRAAASPGGGGLARSDDEEMERLRPTTGAATAADDADAADQHRRGGRGTPAFQRYTAAGSTAAAVMPPPSPRRATPGKDGEIAATVQVVAPTSLAGQRGVDEEDSPAPRGGAVVTHPRVALFAAAMVAAATAASFGGVALEPMPRLGLLAVLVGGLIPLSFWAMPRQTAFGNLFMFILSSLYIQIPGALDYFFLADDTCVKNGPNFDYTYYQTVTGIISAFTGGLGVMLFEMLLSRKKYVYVFVVTTLAKLVASGFDLVLVTRFNVTHLGVSDRAMYLWGNAVVYSAVMMLNFMPMVVLTSRLCPKGVEALMYAILAGFSNFGMNVARTAGELLITRFGIQTQVPCDFAGLPGLVIVAHGVAPLFVLPCAWLLLPSKRLDEPLRDEPGNDVEDDSLDADG